MKVRQSGMPDESLWVSFFEPELILKTLGLSNTAADVVEFGCGYGNFTCPAARLTTGQVHAYDIEPGMVAETRRKATADGLSNVRYYLRDFAVDGTGLPAASAGYAMLFNILHTDQPLLLLKEAYRVLAPNGKLGIMHWNYDSNTPRGPSMEIRPKPAQCQGWAEDAGFQLLNRFVDLPPYHYGLVAGKLSGSALAG